MKRKVIKIDTEKCMGCGDCIPGCPEGALQLIDGKARLISDLFCDGLGACIGTCPVDAIKIEEREAAPYEDKECGCPGAKMIDFSNEKRTSNSEEGKRESELRQWPVQLHLVPPNAPYFKGRDVIFAADCVGYALADFHKDYLKDKSLAIACPKLDSDKEIYINKIKTMIDEAKINTLTVMIMEVPCCSGLLAIAKEAQAQAKRKIPIKLTIVGIKGDILKEEWI